MGQLPDSRKDKFLSKTKKSLKQKHVTTQDCGAKKDRSLKKKERKNERMKKYV